MKRVLCVTAVCVAALALQAGAAAAAPPHPPARAHVAHHTPGSLVAAGFENMRATARLVPLGLRLDGPAAIVGHVYDFNHVGVSGAGVQWWVPSGTDWLSGEATTIADGSYSMGAAPAAANGELDVFPHPNSGDMFARGGASWAVPGPTTLDVWPGRVSTLITRGGPWADFSDYTVRLWGDAVFSMGTVDAGGTSGSPVNGALEILDGTYKYGTVNFFDDEGVEFAYPATITSGALGPATVSVAEETAQRTTVSSPYWASGKPGTKVTVKCDNFPAGWVNRVVGRLEYPTGGPYTSFGEHTASGANPESFELRVPSSAKPGYWYCIGTQHLDGIAKLYLETPFQVCTMKPSKTSIRRGTAIRVRGVVPTAGHWGSTPGARKTVTLFAHRGSAPVPKVWNAASKGWVKVGSVKTNRFGAYKTPLFKPHKTLTLVVRYPGDDWGWNAYTSTKRIRVR